MIIVKTKNGDHFINDKAVIKVEHNKDRATVTCYADNGIYSYMENVEQVVYISDAQPVEWKDEGSELETLKKQLKDISQLVDQYRKKETENIILENRIARLQEKLRDFGCEL